MRFVSVLLLALWCGPALAAPPEVPKAPVLCKVGERPAVVTIAVPAGAEMGVAPAFAPEDVLWFPGETDKGGRKQYLVQPYKPGVYRVVFWTKGETEYSTLVIDATGTAPVPPKPPTPPDPPTPVPVTSFRAVLVFESGATYTPGQIGALHAKSVEDYLTAKCTDGRAGWRRRDRDVMSVSDDSAAFKAFWDKARPAAQGTPCIAFEVNGVVKVEPLPATAAATLELVKKYAEGK